MDRFHIGQKVRLIKSNFFPERVGETFFITEPRHFATSTQDDNIYFVYTLDNGYGAPEEYLSPVYDGDEKSSWSDCAWQPNKVKA